MSTGTDPIPQARLPVMSQDGKTFSLPWLRFFQGIANGTVDPAVIAALEAEIAAAEAIANEALTIAEEALAEASGSALGVDYGIVFAALDPDYNKKTWGFGFEKDVSSGTLGASFLEFVSKANWLIPSGIPQGSVKITGSGPSAQTDFDLQVVTTSVGTIRFATSATEATLICNANATVPSDSTVRIVMPASLNGMTGRLYGSIVGNQI